MEEQRERLSNPIIGFSNKTEIKPNDIVVYHFHATYKMARVCWTNKDTAFVTEGALKLTAVKLNDII